MCSLRSSLALLLLLSGCLELPLPENSSATRPSGPSPAAHWTPRPGPPDHVNLIALGDWGVINDNQKRVAATLASYVGGSPVPFNAILTTGDNFYFGIKSVNDDNWKMAFEEMYDPSRIAVPFYVTLGNHDDGNKIKLEMAYGMAHPHSRWKMPGRWYRLDLPVEEPLVTVLMLDSDRAAMSREEWAGQLAWIDAEMSKPHGPWTVWAAHHPLFSNGDHGDDPAMQKELSGLLRKHHVDFYLCGHEHSLQHLRLADWTAEFIVSGGGGADVHGMKRNDRGPFSRGIHGFVHLEIHADTVRVKYIHGVTGDIVHEFIRQRNGDVAIIRTMPSDVPGQPPVPPAAKALTPSAIATKVTGDDYQQMEKVLLLSGGELARFREARKQRNTAYDAWLATPAGKRFTQLGPELDAARRADDSGKLRVLEPQLDQARAEQEALSRDLRRQFNTAALTPPQLQRWAGHRLYRAVIGRFVHLNLSDEQKQAAHAICVALACEVLTPAAIETDPYLTPAADLVSQAEQVIDEYLLAEDQRDK